MSDQIKEIAGQTPLISTAIRTGVQQSIIPNLQGSYWMGIYPPLGYVKPTVPGTNQLCPWSMVAEVTCAETPHERKQQVLNALRSGQRTMDIYDMPADRILFMEERATRKITVWVD